jgi:hypothetical protein
MNGRAFFAYEETIVEFSGSHIAFVLRSPDIFSMDRPLMLEQYRISGEPIPFEGKARDVILAQVLSKGWVRIRETIGKSGRWTIQFDDWSKRRTTIRYFLRWSSTGGIVKSFDEIVLHGIEDGFFRISDLSEIDNL